MRRKLKRLAGKTAIFVATVADYDLDFRHALLANIRDAEENYLCRHAWVHGPPFVKVAARPDHIVRFMATVKDYYHKRPRRVDPHGKQLTDYGLCDIRAVANLSQAVSGKEREERDQAIKDKSAGEPQ